MAAGLDERQMLLLVATFAMMAMNIMLQAQPCGMPRRRDQGPYDLVETHPEVCGFAAEVVAAEFVPLDVKRGLPPSVLGSAEGADAGKHAVQLLLADPGLEAGEPSGRPLPVEGGHDDIIESKFNINSINKSRSENEASKVKSLRD